MRPTASVIAAAPKIMREDRADRRAVLRGRWRPAARASRSTGRRRRGRRGRWRRRSATRMALPSERKKLKVAVAVPSWCGSTAFWIATVVTGKMVPMPMPVTASSTSTCHSGSVPEPPGEQSPRTIDRHHQPDHRPALVVLRPRHDAPGDLCPGHRAAHQRDQRQARLARRQPDHRLEIERHEDGQADHGADHEEVGGGAGADHRIEHDGERHERLGRGQQPHREQAPGDHRGDDQADHLRRASRDRCCRPTTAPGAGWSRQRPSAARRRRRACAGARGAAGA